MSNVQKFFNQEATLTPHGARFFALKANSHYMNPRSTKAALLSNNFVGFNSMVGKIPIRQDYFDYLEITILVI